MLIIEEYSMLLVFISCKECLVTNVYSFK